MASGFTIGGRYELEALPRGRGGMGQVYFGKDRVLQRRVAVKFIVFRDGVYDPKLVERFRREANLTAQLEHPGVPAVYDVGMHEERPYLVMQVIDGVTLADLVPEQHPLPIGWVAAIGSQICSVLAAAHRAGLVHRDLKPANVMLERDGWVKVLDFGLALDVDDPNRLTSTDAQTPGTPAYMAPEQLATGASSPATDLYALGCTLYEMLTGRPPFEGDTTFAVMTAHASATPDPIGAVRTDVPERIEAVVSELLSKDPLGRPASAEAVLRVLLPHADGATPLPGAVDPSAAGTPRHAYARAVTALFLPAARGAAGASGGDAHAPVQAEPPASAPLDEAAMAQARLRLADDLFASSDFAQAAAAYQAVADQVTAPGGDPGVHLEYATKAATCLALAGQGNLALARLTQLLDEQRPVLGPNDDRILRLRHQVALLQWTCGHHDAARAALHDLQAHLEQLYGPDHPLTRQVRADVDRHARA